MSRINAVFPTSLAAFVALAVMTAAGPAFAAAEHSERSVKTAIHLAGELSVHSQKMSAESLLIALGVEQDRYLDDLRDSRDAFGRILMGLRHGDSSLGLSRATNPEILKRLDKVEEVWPLFDAALAQDSASDAVTAEQVDSMAKLSLPLFSATNDVVDWLEADAARGNLYSTLVVATELSGRQHALLEKLSKEFLLVAYGHAADSNRKNLAGTYERFELVLNAPILGDSGMKLLPAPTPQIRAQLMEVQQLWRELGQPVRAVMAGGQPGPRAIEQVAGQVDVLAETMEEVVHLFEAL